MLVTCNKRVPKKILGPNVLTIPCNTSKEKSDLIETY